MMHKAWCSVEEVPYCFSWSSIKFQGHTGQKNHQFWPKLSVSGLSLQFEFTEGFEMMHKAWCSIEEEVPYYFSRSSIKFQGHTGWKINDLDQIWARLLDRSQLSNPSHLPCLSTEPFQRGTPFQPASQKLRPWQAFKSQLAKLVGPRPLPPTCNTPRQSYTLSRDLLTNYPDPGVTWKQLIISGNSRVFFGLVNLLSRHVFSWVIGFHGQLFWCLHSCTRWNLASDACIQSLSHVLPVWLKC